MELSEEELELRYQVRLLILLIPVRVAYLYFCTSLSVIPG